MVFTKCFKLFFVLLVCIVVHGHVRSEFPEAISPELQELRKRWGAADIIRDLDHIKKDVQKISKMQDSGEINTNEALFYFLRMHDFDDNKKLDGHELLAAIGHSLEHLPDHDVKIEEKEGIVDGFFEYDDDHDGMISYPELRRHLATDESR